MLRLDTSSHEGNGEITFRPAAAAEKHTRGDGRRNTAVTVDGGFQCVALSPAKGAGSDYDVLVVDRFHILRQAMGSLVCLGLNGTISVGTLGCTRVHKLDALFVKGGMALSAHVLTNLEFVSVAGSIKILGDIINEDLRLWICALTRAVQDDAPPAMPPPHETVFGMPPLPAFPILRLPGSHIVQVTTGRYQRWWDGNRQLGETAMKGGTATPKQTHRRSSIYLASHDFKTYRYSNSYEFPHHIHAAAGTSDAAGGGVRRLREDDSAGNAVRGRGGSSTALVGIACGGDGQRARDGAQGALGGGSNLERSDGSGFEG